MSSTFFKHQTVRDAIKAVISERKAGGVPLTYDKIAESCGIQKAYVSKALTGKAELNQDQLYKIGRLLKLTQPEYEYLTVLLEIERTGLSDRRDALAVQANKLRDEYLNRADYLSKESKEKSFEQDHFLYFSDPLVQIIHLALLIPRFSRSPNLLASALGTTQGKITSTIKILEKMKLITRTGDQLKAVVPDTHMTRKADIYPVWRHLLRSLSNTRLQQLHIEKSYAFSVTFTADSRTKDAIQYKFLEFINEMKKAVETAPSDQCYQVNFDLFPWLDI